MQLLRSISVDSAHSLLKLVRFGLLTFLQSIRDLLLLYPANVAIFCILIFVIVFKLVNRFRGRQKFKAVYTPLKHEDNNLEEVRLLKKQIRQIQTQLIDMLKKSKQQPGNQGDPNQQGQKRQMSQEQEQLQVEIKQFLREEAQRSQTIELVQDQLKKTVREAYEQINKLNTN